MLKVLTVVGTRPEIIKLSCVIDKLDQNFNHILVNTYQNSHFELNKIFFQQMKLRKPDYNLKVTQNDKSLIIAEILKNITPILKKEKPDVFLIYGDTNSCMTAIVAKNLKIPILHMEAGNRSYDQRVSEELNRKIIDHISDINVVVSDVARQNLIREGINPEFILKSGSHMQEVFEKYQNFIDKSDILKKLKINEKKYFIVSLHRSEMVDNKNDILNIFNTLDSIAKIYKLPLIVSLHPRTKFALKKLKFIYKKNINFIKPLGFFDYTKLQKNALCVISDSGSIFEESYLMNFKSISIRKSHERLEGMESGNIIMTGYETKNILRSLKTIRTNNFSQKSKYHDYEGGNVSQKIVNYILSYYHKINEKNWFKRLN